MGGEHSKNVGPDLAIALSYAPLIGYCPHPRALPYTKNA